MRCTSSCCTRRISSAFPTAIQMARDHGDAVRDGAGAEEDRQRDHARAGRARNPSRQRQARRLLSRARRARSLRRSPRRLKRARDIARTVLRWVAALRLSRISSRTTNSWRCGIRTEYPINEGRLVSSRGIDIAIADYETEFEERHVAHSTALHSVVKAARRLSRRPAGALRAQLRSPAGASCRRWRARRAWTGLPQSVQEHHRPRRRNWSMPARRRCG